MDSQGNELVSKSGTGPADNFLDAHGNVMKDLAKDICCSKSKKIKCAKTGSIDIDVDYDITTLIAPQTIRVLWKYYLYLVVA